MLWTIDRTAISLMKTSTPYISKCANNGGDNGVIDKLKDQYISTIWEIKIQWDSVTTSIRDTVIYLGFILFLERIRKSIQESIRILLKTWYSGKYSNTFLTNVFSTRTRILLKVFRNITAELPIAIYTLYCTHCTVLFTPCT